MWPAAPNTPEFTVQPDMLGLFAYAGLTFVVGDTNHHSAGWDTITAINQMKFAATLERAGHADLAAQQWRAAEDLLSRCGTKVSREVVEQQMQQECQDATWKKLGL